MSCLEYISFFIPIKQKYFQLFAYSCYAVVGAFKHGVHWSITRKIMQRCPPTNRSVKVTTYVA